MKDGLDSLPPEFLSGDETFDGSGIKTSLRLRDYWRWSASSLMDNTGRGILAEFLVATALRESVRAQPRVEWDTYDLLAMISGRKVSIEVKSSSRVQAWKQQRYSDLQFNIRPTHKWSPKTGKYSEHPLRAEIYVFCALVETAIQSHRDAMNVDHWLFRVAPKRKLPCQKMIRWDRLSQYASQPIRFENLRMEIEAIVGQVSS